jgi:hypothetical protein
MSTPAMALLILLLGAIAYLMIRTQRARVRES